MAFKVGRIGLKFLDAVGVGGLSPTYKFKKRIKTGLPFCYLQISSLPKDPERGRCLVFTGKQ